jgi:Mce-associated membrane protein
MTMSTLTFVILAVAVVIVVFALAALWRVFAKAGQPGWAAIVPFYNIYILLRIVGRPGWWLVLFLIPVANLVVGIIVAIDLARAFGRGPTFGVLGLFLFPYVGYAILGFGSARFHTDEGADDAEPQVREPNYVVLAGLALVMVAAFFAVWYGVSWANSANDDTLSRAKTRDEVDRIARQAIITFHTLDYRKVDEGLDNWQNASTGALRDEVVGRRASAKQAIQDAKTITSANVLSLAVTELNRDEGKATVIAAVEVAVTPEGKQAEKKYMRIQGVLERAGDGWKLSGIGQVDFARS